MKETLNTLTREKEDTEEEVQKKEEIIIRLREELRVVERELREFKWKVVNSAT